MVNLANECNLKPVNAIAEAHVRRLKAGLYPRSGKWWPLPEGAILDSEIGALMITDIAAP